jgi:hypothetical protein
MLKFQSYIGSAPSGTTGDEIQSRHAAIYQVVWNVVKRRPNRLKRRRRSSRRVHRPCRSFDFMTNLSVA